MNIEEAKRIGMRWKMLGDELAYLITDTMNSVPKNTKAWRRLSNLDNCFGEAKSWTESAYFERIDGMDKYVFYGCRPDWHDEFMHIVDAAVDAQTKELEERKNKPVWQWENVLPINLRGEE